MTLEGMKANFLRRTANLPVHRLICRSSGSDGSTDNDEGGTS